MRFRSPLDERSRILLGHLRSRDSKREDYVREALAEMEPGQAVEMLLDWKRSMPRWWIELAGAIGIYISVYWVIGFVFHPREGFFGGAIGPICVCLVMFVLARRHTRNRVYEFLAQYDDKRIADVLIEAVHKGDSQTQRAAEPTLLRLLSTMAPGDWHLLSPASRSFLNRRLLESDNKHLVNAILAAWEQVGDHDSIPIVERLSRGEGVLGGDFSIRHAAAEALPAIREAANRAAMSETLLRAANPNESSPALLRPASSTETIDQVLLRPPSD